MASLTRDFVREKVVNPGKLFALNQYNKLELTIFNYP